MVSTLEGMSGADGRYRALFDAVESGFCIVEVDLQAAGGRVDYRVVEANPAFHAQTGFPEAIIGRWLREAAPALEEHWYERYGRVARTGRPERFEQGSEALGRWFDVYAFRIGDPASGQVAILFNDISARRAAELALQESEGRFRNMADHAPVMVWCTDPDGRCTYLNRAWYEFTGQTETEALGLGWLDAAHPEDRAEAERVFLRANAERRAFRLEYRLRRADGAYRWAIDAAAPRFDAEGAFAGFVGSVIDIDERREAEAALRASEEFGRRILQSSTDCIKVLGLDGRLEFMSEGGMCVMEVDDLHAVAGASWPDLWEGGEHAKAADAVATARAGGDARFEGFARTIKGSPRWWDVAVTPINGADGRPEKLLAVSRDVTRQREAETALRELNETLERRVAAALAERQVFAQVLENAVAAVTVLDLEGRVLAINRANADAFERAFGARPEVGHALLDLVADKPEHQAQMRRHWDRALAGEAFMVTDTFGDEGLERRTFEARFDVLRDRDGRQVGASATSFDVTDRVRAAAELRAAETARRKADALYRAYFENTAEALFVVAVLPDGGFAIEELNPAHEAATGLKSAEVRGKRLEEQLAPDLLGPVVANYARAIEAGRPISYRESLMLPSGPRHFDTVLVPVADEDGTVTRIIGSSRDVTAQVNAEEALRQAQKLESMGQLTGGVAHDFNNLLTPIVGALDLLERRGFGGERERRLLQGAAQSAERARTLVQRLLAFARRQPLQATAVDVAELVRGMAELVASTTGPQVRLMVEPDEGLPFARADANQLEMALLNLAVNARDAMPEGGTLRVGATAERVADAPDLSPGGYVRLFVADTGHGMDEATAARAVEPFFSTKGVGKGTGLGLSMVHGLASQLGGALRVRSAPGEGTTVELWLPESAAAPDAPRAAPAPSAATARPRGAALLVDDEEQVRASTAAMLGELGFRVEEAASAEEALRRLRDGPAPELVVTDHLMPGMTGAELARAVRAGGDGPPVLLVSGYAEGEGIEPDLPRLTKPFRTDELAAAVAALEMARV